MCYRIDSRCVIGPENILFPGASVYLAFSPKILQAGAVKGLNCSAGSTKPVFIRRS